MTEFETEVRAHLDEMLKRPMTASEQALLEKALDARRQAAALVAESLK